MISSLGTGAAACVLFLLQLFAALLLLFFVVGGGDGHGVDESRDLAGVGGDAGWASGSRQFRRMDC